MEESTIDWITLQQPCESTKYLSGAAFSLLETPLSSLLLQQRLLFFQLLPVLRGQLQPAPPLPTRSRRTIIMITIPVHSERRLDDEITHIACTWSLVVSLKRDVHSDSLADHPKVQNWSRQGQTDCGQCRARDRQGRHTRAVLFGLFDFSRGQTCPRSVDQCGTRRREYS